ncbi:hypothetical protein Daesc_008036 [Daldinia eschscholtzii]|uniref:Uncharacterized protein n=1 Tax=Daldinia eschscholtzii TaxID=292717 RepID=A0AAX6MBB4_9PEZI
MSSDAQNKPGKNEASDKPFTYDEEMMKEWKHVKHVAGMYSAIAKAKARLHPCNFETGHPRIHTDEDLKLVRDAKSAEDYWKGIIVEHPVAPWINFDDVAHYLGEITPGKAVTETNLYKTVRNALEEIIGQCEGKEPADVSSGLANSWPSSEMLEALRIYGDAKKGFGYLPGKIFRRLKQAKLTHLLYQHNTPDAIPDNFWIGVIQARNNSSDGSDGEPEDGSSVEKLLNQEVHEFTDKLQSATDRTIQNDVSAVDQKYREVTLNLHSEFRSMLKDVEAKVAAVRDEATAAKEEAEAARSEVKTLSEECTSLKTLVHSLSSQTQSGGVNLGRGVAGGSNLTMEEVYIQVKEAFEHYTSSKQLGDTVEKYIADYLASEKGKEILFDSATNDDVVKFLKGPMMAAIKPEVLSYVKSKINTSSSSSQKVSSPSVPKQSPDQVKKQQQAPPPPPPTQASPSVTSLWANMFTPSQT